MYITFEPSINEEYLTEDIKKYQFVGLSTAGVLSGLSTVKAAYIGCIIMVEFFLSLLALHEDICPAIL